MAPPATASLMAWRAVVVLRIWNSTSSILLAYHPHAGSFLISEAVRGEGGILRLPNGERFMQRFDERAELAPRDIVARAIDHEMKRIGADCVYLDISHRSADFIHGHFPNIAEKCASLGINITRDAIPVVPAAHYSAVASWSTNGRSDLAHLYVIGEASCTVCMAQPPRQQLIVMLGVCTPRRRQNPNPA